MIDPIAILETDIEVAKAAFGVALADAELRGGKFLPLAIALAIGLNPSLAYIAASSWVNDPITVDARARQIAENVPPVPTKEQIAHKLLGIADSNADDKDKIAALDLVAKMFEYVPRPQTNIDARTQISQTHHVTMMPELPEDWEAKLLQEQRKSMADAGA